MIFSRFDAIVKRVSDWCRPENVFALLSLPLFVFYISTFFAFSDYLHGTERYLHVVNYALWFRGEEGQMPAGFIALAEKATPHGRLQNQYGSQLERWTKKLRRYGYSIPSSERLPRNAYERFQVLSNIELNPENIIRFRTATNPATYSIVGYLPFIVPAYIGLAFELKPISIFYLMIITNGLLSIWLAYLIIRLAPILKWTFVWLLLIPSICANRSLIMPDAIAIETCFLMVAMVLRHKANGSLMSLRQQVRYILLGAVIGIVKIAYFFLSAITLLLPTALFRNSSSRALFLCLVFTASLVSSVSWTIYIGQKKYHISLEETEQATKASSKIQNELKNILLHPLPYAGVMLNCFIHPQTLTVWITNLTFWPSPEVFRGKTRKADQLILRQASVFSFIFLVLLSMFPYSRDGVVRLRVIERLWSIALFAAVAAVILLLNHLFHVNEGNARFTPEVLAWIVQGRYFIPVLPLLALALYRLKLPLPERLNSYLPIGTLLAALAVMVVLHIVMLVY